MSELLEELANGVLTLTINRPPLNAFSPSLPETLINALRRSEHNPDVRSIVLTGAGGDVGSVSDSPSDESTPGKENDPEAKHAAAVKFIRNGMEPTRMLHKMSKPTLAVMPGAAAGSGLALALAYDSRFCLDTAKLTTAFAKIGL